VLILAIAAADQRATIVAVALGALLLLALAVLTLIAESTLPPLPPAQPTCPSDHRNAGRHVRRGGRRHGQA
jgi:hypothetical protein